MSLRQRSRRTALGLDLCRILSGWPAGMHGRSPGLVVQLVIFKQEFSPNVARST